ncbi:hypothetical protein P3342_010978 [Pyrenophora teres f. teres]|nr:hypothetical protein P3342_010978 [Pyrenophora teres f. teres]
MKPFPRPTSSIPAPLTTLPLSLHHAITPAAPATAPTNPIFLYPLPPAAPVACALALANVIVLLTPSVVVVDIAADALVFVISSLELELPLTRLVVPFIGVTVALERTGGAVSIARPVGTVASVDAGGVRKLA